MTADDALARLSVINLVHEARGLDTSEGTMLVGLGFFICTCIIDRIDPCWWVQLYAHV